MIIGIDWLEVYRAINNYYDKIVTLHPPKRKLSYDKGEWETLFCKIVCFLNEVLNALNWMSITFYIKCMIKLSK